MLTPPRTLLTILLTALVGCSSSLDALDDTDASNDTDGWETGDTDDTDIEDPYSGPSFWAVDGTLALRDGAVDIAASSLGIRFTDSEGRPWQEDEFDPVRCEFEVLGVADGPAEALEGEPILGWWQLDVRDTGVDDSACAWTPPEPATATDTGEHVPLVLGIGEFDSRLLPALEAAGYSAALDLYGLYVLHPSPDGDVVYVFGVAGTAAQFEGSDTTVEAPHLPAGDYSLETLILLPVPEASQR